MALSNVISPYESLARYLLEKSKFSMLKNSVLPSGFMPTANLDLSVYRIDNLEIEEIWEIGRKDVIAAMTMPKELYGIAKIKASKVLENGLEIKPQEPPPRHANMIGWPKEKERQKMIAIELAAESELKLVS